MASTNDQQMGRIRDAVLIAGPTASGKSALAIKIARQEHRVIVNADSMQVYGVLHVLTARPSGDDLRWAEHLLYGHVDPSRTYSTGAWLREVQRLHAADAFGGRGPILVGGTGLYFKALTEGLSEIPEIPESIRSAWRSKLIEQGPDDLHRILAERDPESAAVLAPADGHRIVRALEVLEASGKSIRAWRQRPAAALIDAGTARKIVLEVDRAVLARRIDERFDRMMELGALDEARAIASMNLPDDATALVAIGVRQLIAADRGEVSLDEAVRRSKDATRQYAKRQSTWFRNQFGEDWTRSTQ